MTGYSTLAQSLELQPSTGNGFVAYNDTIIFEKKKKILVSPGRKKIKFYFEKMCTYVVAESPTNGHKHSP